MITCWLGLYPAAAMASRTIWMLLRSICSSGKTALVADGRRVACFLSARFSAWKIYTPHAQRFRTTRRGHGKTMEF